MKIKSLPQLDDYEGALKVYISSWSPKDRSIVKEFKKSVSGRWGNWQECLKFAPRSNERKVLTYLRDYPRDFVKAINLISPRLLSIFVAAYQSYLWNEMAKELIKLYFEKE
jgi:tRNA pseudouridine13 synthase